MPAWLGLKAIGKAGLFVDSAFQNWSLSRAHRLGPAQATACGKSVRWLSCTKKKKSSHQFKWQWCDHIYICIFNSFLYIYHMDLTVLFRQVGHVTVSHHKKKSYNSLSAITWQWNTVSHRKQLDCPRSSPGLFFWSQTWPSGLVHKMSGPEPEPQQPWVRPGPKKSQIWKFRQFINLVNCQIS